MQLLNQILNLESDICIKDLKRIKSIWFKDLPSSRDRLTSSTVLLGMRSWMTWFSKKSATPSMRRFSTWLSLAMGSSARGSKDLAERDDPVPTRVMPSTTFTSRAALKLSTYFRALSCELKGI